MRRRPVAAVVGATAVVAVCVLVATGCGVTTQDEPQLIEESTPRPPAATPSFDTDPSPATGGSAAATTTTTTSAPPSPIG